MKKSFDPAQDKPSQKNPNVSKVFRETASLPLILYHQGLELILWLFDINQHTN